MKRFIRNPLISRGDIPAIKPHLIDVSSVFNPGAIKYENKTILLLRVQNRGRETFFLKAVSHDGVRFSIDNCPVYFSGIGAVSESVYHIYDARITTIDNRHFIVFAMDMESGCYLGLAETDDFKHFEFKGVISERDTRNGVLFPEKIDGRYLLLERPNNTSTMAGVMTGQTVWLSESEDLLHWKRLAPVFSGRPHYWDEYVGSGPPPVKTRKGWLHIYHGVATHFAGVNIYQAGVVLLDLENPSKVIARSKYNILEPREMYEMVGQVPNVVFPSGLIAREYDSNGFANSDSPIFIYYGAADTSVCLAETTIKSLINACFVGSEEKSMEE